MNHFFVMDIFSLEYTPFLVFGGF